MQRHDDVATLPAAPTAMIMAISTLPVQQYRKQNNDWLPVMVTADGDDLVLADGDAAAAFSDALAACLPDTINDGEIVKAPLLVKAPCSS